MLISDPALKAPDRGRPTSPEGFESPAGSVLHPKDDVAARTPVWEVLQMLFMDTDPAEHLYSMAVACARSPYTIEELEQILFQEVLPAGRFNLFALPVPEWGGFETQWLVESILRKQRFGRRGRSSCAATRAGGLTPFSGERRPPGATLRSFAAPDGGPRDRLRASIVSRP